MNLLRYFWWLVSSLFRKSEPDNPVSPGSVVTGKKADEIIKTIGTQYWLSETGTLHNPLCRWYERCKGQSVTDLETIEFTDCDSCGGSHPIVREWNLPKDEK